MNNVNTKFFGRITEDGNVAVFHNSGETATRLDVAGVYPVGSDLSVRYEHPSGIVLTMADAERIGLIIED